MCTLLLIETLDEMVFGAREAAWPLIRRDLHLEYVQVGILLALPNVTSALVEPLLGVLGDAGYRRRLIVGGGVAFTLALFLVAVGPAFGTVLAAFAVWNSASGSFVGLSQATLMDAEPERRERNMVLWTAAGAVGALLGPTVIAGSALLHHGWRGPFATFALLTVPIIVLAVRQLGNDANGEEETGGLWEALSGAFQALRRRDVLRWLLLLEAADLLLDVFLGYLGLYLVDHVGISPSQAALGVMVWTGAGLAGTALMVPVLARVQSMRYLRLSAVGALVSFPAFLLAPGLGPKLVLAGLLAVMNAGWYPVLKAQLYGVLPEHSGTAMAVSTIFGTGAGLLPFVLSLGAQAFGVQTTLWFLLIGPLVIVLGVETSGRRGT